MLRAEDKVHIVSHLMSSHQSPMFIKTLLDSSPHYDRLRKKRPFLPTVASLRCEGHPFFEDLSDISRDINLFMINYLLLKKIFFANVLCSDQHFD